MTDWRTLGIVMVGTLNKCLERKETTPLGWARPRLPRVTWVLDKFCDAQALWLCFWSIAPELCAGGQYSSSWSRVVGVGLVWGVVGRVFMSQMQATSFSWSTGAFLKRWPSRIIVLLAACLHSPCPGMQWCYTHDIKHLGILYSTLEGLSGWWRGITLVKGKSENIYQLSRLSHPRPVVSPSLWTRRKPIGENLEVCWSTLDLREVNWGVEKQSQIDIFIVLPANVPWL